MMHKRKFSHQLRQSKITAFCSRGGNDAECNASRWGRKRKNSAEVSEAYMPPLKRPSRSDCLSPDIFQNCPGGASDENDAANSNKTELENYLFEDFENDPFLSPRKKESPKKNFLRENFSVNENWSEAKSEINFEILVKCKIIKAEFILNKCFEQVLLLRDCKSGGKGICRLRDVWTSFSFSIDDVVSIQATCNEGDWVVDNKSGFVILNPDVMVPSTTLVSSMFCMRQGVLANYFKDMDSGDVGKMLIGRLVHEIFQESLRKKKTCSEEDFGKIITEFLGSRENLHDIFFSDMDISDIEEEMKKFIPSLKNFLDIYVENKLEPGDKNFKGTIERVLDIEETVMSPKLGFQGRMDVTVRVRTKNGEKVAPLELKTGRASFSNQHRSQLILYVLLMNELGRKVESGLLLYLRDNVMEEIFPTRDEIRNLFLLRNHFVKFYKGIGTHNLPEPIRNIKSCNKCAYLKVCTAYLRGGKNSQIPEMHPLRNFEIPDIMPSHVDYFIKWNEMLWLEFEEAEKMADDELSQLKLRPQVETFAQHFKLDFVSTTDPRNKALRSGTFVYVMNEEHRICSGQIVDVTDSVISVLADKIPKDFSAPYKLIILKSKFLNFYLSNLGWLMKEEFKNLRELIIDKRMPTFEKNFDKTDFQEKCLKTLLDLNKEQRKAILKALLCRDYLLIKGPPGTGKTQTIIALIKVLLALSKTVLIASHTNSSVDNILLKLEGVEYLRLGALRSIHEDIRRNSYVSLRERYTSLDDIKKLFQRKLFASTCMGIDANVARRMKVDVCILDESSQILQMEALRPLFCCRKFILVGDENQLPPVVRNLQAKKLGMCQSIFGWLKNDQASVNLRLQYRMNSVINSLANAITYGGLIECANEGVAKKTMEIPNTEEYNREEEWVVDILSNDLENSVVFVDTSEYFRLNRGKLESKPRSSVLEANIIVRLVRSLIKMGLEKHSVGVICPFWDQIMLLKSKLSEENLEGIELNTVDQYQGRDKDVIVISCTKENRSDMMRSELELLSDERRLTVAVTRAKHKLVILGDKETVVKYEPFRKLISTLKQSQFFCLSDGEKGFFWKKFS